MVIIYIFLYVSYFLDTTAILHWISDKKVQVKGEVQAAIMELQDFPRPPLGTIQLYLAVFDSFHSFCYM